MSIHAFMLSFLAITMGVYLYFKYRYLLYGAALDVAPVVFFTNIGQINVRASLAYVMAALSGGVACEQEEPQREIACFVAYDKKLFKCILYDLDKRIIKEKSHKFNGVLFG